ncbi:MAG: energy transducer TonB [Candidatus Obscuribacterales bacterium]|nr:energy transducer TonB [Candidatus Obscuribacterales bacterium]
MTPSSDKNSQSDSQNNSELLKAIGDPATTEEEWLSACEKLGDYQQPKSRKKNIPLLIGQSALAAAVMTAFIYGGITISSLNNSKPVPAPVAHAPVPPAADIDYGPYMADLQRRIKRAWYPPRGNETRRVVVIFKVHSSGAMDGLKISKSSGVPVADAAALKAVEDAAPFKTLPAKEPENVDIQFTFDYNVFAGNKRF